MFFFWPKAIVPCLCLALCLPGRAEAQSREHLGPPANSAVAHEDPFLVAMLGAMPLLSGFYLTSAPQKGAVFTLADAVLIGSILKIRSDKNIPQKDAAVYAYLLGAVNVADMALSLMQFRSDAASRLTLIVIPTDQPGLLLAWRF
ncbi:MAG: hypothetical protein ABI036_17815 [Fibrobacteria bacterium]